MLEKIFPVILDMTITGTVTVALVVIIRWIFRRRMPAIFRYALWGIVLIRLVVPFSIPSVFSIFNIFDATPYFENTIYHQRIQKQVNQYEYDETTSNIRHETNNGNLIPDSTANDALNNNSNFSLSEAAPEESTDLALNLMRIISWIWFVVATCLFISSLYAYFYATCKLKEAVLYKNEDLIFKCKGKIRMNCKVQVYTSDKVHTPVVCGLINPRIIFPLNIAKEHNGAELEYILTHELVHIKRFDNIIKPISVLALCMHWFNPAAWLAFILSHKDMEMSCDEKVISAFDNDIRSDYAASLISVAEKQSMMLNGGLLAFGENNIKSRIKGIMSFKKPQFWIGTVIAAIIIAVSVLLLTGGQYEQDKKQVRGDEIIAEDGIRDETESTETSFAESTNTDSGIDENSLNDEKNNVLFPVSQSADADNDPQTDVILLKVEILLEEIMENVDSDSSDPLNYIKDSKALNELVAIGEPALNVMMEMFANSNEDGLKEYVMAIACAKIMGVYNDERGIGISSGREWFYKYGTFETDIDFKIVDADYDLFKDSSSKPELILPAHTNMKDMEDVISKCILVKDRSGYLDGEKAIESHKVYGTEEKDGIINVYMMVCFRWFEFEDRIFTVVSGGNYPLRIQLKKKENGEYEVLEYKQAMDGGMWAESIREIFPKEIAEIVISDDKKTHDELWNIQVAKAEQYLKEINREDALVMSRVEKNRTDDKAARKAMYLVTQIRRDFPDWIGTREMLVRTGGKYPGMNIRCTLETQCEKISGDQHDVDEYIITLTKTWDIEINGVQPVSYWKYRVSGEKVELIEEQDNDSSIKLVK